MIFDVKMKDFPLKARLVAGGHMMETPDTMTYARVVSRETVCLALVIDALNYLEIKYGDVMNAHITVPIEEKVCSTLRPEFGNDAGKRALLFRALYGLKPAVDDFCAHLGRCMQGLGF